MSISSQIEAKVPTATPEPSDNLSSEFLEIPSCTIEDVDRALFNLFDRDMPLLYTHRNDTKRVPIVFATGERFALIARKKPLRDRSNALILPVISIMRSGILFNVEAGMAVAPDIKHVIKRQLGKEDPIYQRLTNRLGLQNSDDLASPSAFIDIQNQRGAEAGRLASRRAGAGSVDAARQQAGNLLDPNLGNNIYEIYEIPAPTFFTATYEVTLWTQYTQEMNNLLAVIATENHFNATNAYRIETDKGYYFVAYFDATVSADNNFDDFSEEERLVRSSMTVTVPGYFVGTAYKGSPNKVRKFVSAPQLSFEVSIGDSDGSPTRQGIPTGDPGDLIMQDFLTTEDSQPGQFIGGTGPIINAKNATPSIGGYSSPVGSTPSPEVVAMKSPFSAGKPESNFSVSKSRTSKQGETTYREIT